MTKIASNDSCYLTPNELFEYRANLAKTNPEKLENELREELERIILDANPKNREGLRQLQWRIDMEKKRAKNPTDAMLRLQKMMWGQFYADDGFISIPSQWSKAIGINNEIRELTNELKESLSLLLKKD